MNNSTCTYQILAQLPQHVHSYWWSYLICIGISLILYQKVMESVSNIWNFGQDFGNAVIVEKAKVEHPFETSHGEAFDVVYANPNGSSSMICDERVSQANVDIVHLKKVGLGKYCNKDYGGALIDFNEANIIEPHCVSTLKYLGEIKRILGQFEDALEDFNQANEIQPNNAFILSTRGTVKRELKDLKNALEDLQKANELGGNAYFIKVQLGVVKRDLADFEGALVDLNEANALKEGQAFVETQLGSVKRELGKFDEALAHLNRAYKLDPNYGFLYQQRGVVHRELKNLQGSLDDFNMADKIMPNNPYTLRRRGVTKRELLDYQGSLEDLNMANNLEPYNDLTLNELGVTKKLLRDFQGALEDLTMANHIKSNQAFTLKHRGSANRELGNHKEALQDLNYANDLEPNDFFTLLELGMTKNLNHDYEDALNYFNKVLVMVPNDSWILQQRCFTKYAMKDIAGALQDANIALKHLGMHGQFSILGMPLKPATIQSAIHLTRSSNRVVSIAQRLNDIDISSSPQFVLWIDHRKLLFVKNLGRGSYGYVQQCKWEGKNRLVAVKYVSSQIQDAFAYEVKMLAIIQHPRVVRLIGCSYDIEEQQGLLVMELMEYNLRSLIDVKICENGLPFDLTVAVHIMIQIAEAMEYLHEHGVLHRDLKSSNVLVNASHIPKDGKEEYVVKIADFGMAKFQGKKKSSYFMTVDVGATLWRAPEVFKGAHLNYSFPADVWSYGITCYEILSGGVPFEGVACAQLRTKILCGLRPNLPTSCPSVLKLLLNKCWSLMPLDRPTFSNIHKTLKLYLGTITSKDVCDFRGGDAVPIHQLCELSQRNTN